MELNSSDSSSRSELAIACSEGDYARAKELLAIGSDPVTSRAGYFNWSPLHYTARQGQLDFAQLLISQYSCHPQVEDKEGRTPLHVACQYGQLEFARYLIQQKRCDASYTDVEDQTPLHHTCGWLSECTEEEALTISKYLITKAKCDPNARDVNGKTCVLHACEKGFLSVLRYFVEDRQCDLSAVDYKGNNALHLAISFSNNLAVVEYILSKSVVDLEAVNNSGNNVLHMAAIAKCSLDVCKLILEQKKSTLLIETLNESRLTPLDLANDELIHYALTRFQIHSYKFYEKYSVSLGVKQTPASQMRVFIVGDSKSGKTTLVNSLRKEVSSFSLSFSSHSPVSQLVEEVRGLVVTDHESKVYGNVTFFDFSGHSDYEYIQESVLQHSIYPSFSVFVVVIDQQKLVHDMHSSIHHWLSFISRAWKSTSNDKLKVIIVGSHADAVKPSSKSHRGGFKSISMDAMVSTFTKLEIVSKLQVDCQKTDHSGIVSLRKQLNTLSSKIEDKNSLSFNAACLLTYLKSRFLSLPAVKLETLVSNIKMYELEVGTIHDVRYFLSDDSSILIRLLCSLDKAGHIHFLKNENDVNESVVLTQAPEVFADLTKLWNCGGGISPKFVEHHDLLPQSAISAAFPDLEPDILHQIFIHLNLSTEVNIHLGSSSSEQTKHIYFPSLLSSSSPLYVWDYRCSYEHYCGWMVEAVEDASFSLSFIHNVLSQCLSASTSSLSIDSLSLWKNGMYFRSTANGAITEALVEALDDHNTFVLLMRAQRFDPSALQCRSIIIKEIRQCLTEGSSLVESLIDPFEAMHYPLPTRRKLTLFPLTEVIRSIQSGDLYVRSNGKFEVVLTDLMYFEPFLFIGNHCMTIISKAKKNDLISHEFLKAIAKAMSSNIQMLHLVSHIFSFTPTEFRPCTDELYSALLSWNTRTYTDLVKLLECYSIFSVTDFI